MTFDGMCRDVEAREVMLHKNHWRSLLKLYSVLLNRIIP